MEKSLISGQNYSAYRTKITITRGTKISPRNKSRLHGKKFNSSNKIIASVEQNLLLQGNKKLGRETNQDYMEKSLISGTKL
jgi:hypothetical protein